MRATVGLVVLALLTGRARAETLAEQAMKAYEAKDYERSATLFVQAAEAGDRDPDTLYAAASLSARLGRKEIALRYLRAAFEAGFSDLDGMEGDPDVGSVRSDPRYRALVAEYGARFGRTRAVVDGPALKTPYREDLPENEKIAGLSRLRAEDGKELVGRGVQPTRIVRTTVADVRAGRDPVLEAARKEILR